MTITLPTAAIPTLIYIPIYMSTIRTVYRGKSIISALFHAGVQVLGIHFWTIWKKKKKKIPLIISSIGTITHLKPYYYRHQLSLREFWHESYLDRFDSYCTGQQDFELKIMTKSYPIEYTRKQKLELPTTEPPNSNLKFIILKYRLCRSKSQSSVAS